MQSKNIFVLIVVFLTAISCQVLKNREVAPLEWTPKTYSFAMPELQIDSTFLANLNTTFMDSIISTRKDKDRKSSWRHFHIYFKKEDSLNYCLVVSLWNIPARKAAGFIEYDGFLYWFGGNEDTPPNIILGTKSERQFSYEEPIPAPYDPPFWFLKYNHQTGNIKVREKDCF